MTQSIANECGVDGKKLQAAARAVPPCSSWQAAQGTVTFVVTVAFTVVTGALGVLYTATHGEVLAAYLGILDDDEVEEPLIVKAVSIVVNRLFAAICIMQANCCKLGRTYPFFPMPGLQLPASQK